MKKISKVISVRHIFRVPLNVCKKLSKKVLFPFIIKCFPFVIKWLQNKVIYAPRINNLKLHKLEAPLFGSVFFEVRTKCNSKCEFCAASTQNEVRKDTYMPMELYTKGIDELKILQFSGGINYHVNNDPLIFPRLIEFVQYARHSLKDASIGIMTNGNALTLKLAEELVKAGINRLYINNYQGEQNHLLPELVTNVLHNILPKFYTPDQIKIGQTGHDHYSNKKTFCFNVVSRAYTEVLTSRGGTAPNKKLKSTTPIGFCEFPFTQFNITTDGRVSKCCADFYFSDPMGNLYEQSILEIWRGNNFNEVRHNLLKGNRRKNKHCKECDFYGVDRKFIDTLPRVAKILYDETNKGAKIFRRK